MSVFSGALRPLAVAAMAGAGLLAATSAALACDCDGGGYYRPYYGYNGNYSCYGGGYDCGYDGYYRHHYYHRYYGDYDDGYYRHHYDGYYRHRDCDDDCY